MNDLMYNGIFTIFTITTIFLSVNLVFLINGRNNDVSILKKLYIALFISAVNVFPYILKWNSVIAVSFVLTMIAMFAAYWLLAKRSVVQAFILTFIHFIVSSFIEFSGMLLMNLFNFNESIGEAASSPERIAIVRLVAVSILLVLNIVFLIIRSKKKGTQIISTETATPVIMQVLLTIMLVVPNIIYFDYTHSSMSSFFVLFNFFSALVMISYSIFSMKKQHELTIREKELELAKLTGKSMEISLEKLRQFKHDFPNFIQSVNGCSYLKDWDRLDDLIRSTKAEYSISRAPTTIDAHFKKAPAFYGILITKVMAAEAQNIEINIRVDGEILIPALNMVRVNKILGILLDNALEAAMESKERKVNILFSSDGYIQEIKISNSFTGTVDVEKIFELGVSGKESHSGIGLHEVKHIVDSNPHLHLDTEVENNMFAQSLIIDVSHLR